MKTGVMLIIYEYKYIIFLCCTFFVVYNYIYKKRNESVDDFSAEGDFKKDNGGYEIWKYIGEMF